MDEIHVEGVFSLQHLSKQKSSNGGHYRFLALANIIDPPGARLAQAGYTFIGVYPDDDVVLTHTLVSGKTAKGCLHFSFKGNANWKHLNANDLHIISSDFPTMLCTIICGLLFIRICSHKAEKSLPAKDSQRIPFNSDTWKYYFLVVDRYKAVWEEKHNLFRPGLPMNASHFNLFSSGHRDGFKQDAKLCRIWNTIPNNEFTTLIICKNCLSIKKWKPIE